MIFTIFFAFLCLLMLQQNDSIILKSVCPKNMTFKVCGTPCPERCEDHGPRPCVRMCANDVCQCKKGYVIDRTGRCVKRKDCEKRIEPPPLPLNESCPENTVPSACASTCPKFCFDREVEKRCRNPCVQNACECKTPYVYDVYGKCVLKDKCDEISSHRCYEDMIYSLCPNREEKTCSTLKRKSKSVTCGVPKCICKPGYVKIRGECYKKSKCKKLKKKVSRHSKTKSG